MAVAGAGLLTGCEIQDPNNPVIKKLGYGTTLGTTGGLLKSVDTEGTIGVFTFTVKNNSDAPLPMDPNESFVVKVLDYAEHAPNPEDTLEFTYIPLPAKSPELRMTWKILGADLVKSNESTGK